MTVGLGFEAIAATWANQLDPSMALGATAAGWRVVFDLEYADAGAWEALHRYARSCPGPAKIVAETDRLAPGGGMVAECHRVGWRQDDPSVPRHNRRRQAVDQPSGVAAKLQSERASFRIFASLTAEGFAALAWIL